MSHGKADFHVGLVADKVFCTVRAGVAAPE
jgi:hypothetical protein